MWKFPWKKFKGWNSRLKTLETNVGVAIEKSSRVKIQGWKLHHILSIRGQTLNLYLSTMKIKGNSGVIWPLKRFRGYNSRSKSISEEKETVNLHFSTMKKNSRVNQDLYQIWPLKEIFRGLNSRMKWNIESFNSKPWKNMIHGLPHFAKFSGVRIQHLKIIPEWKLKNSGVIQAMLWILPLGNVNQGWNVIWILHNWQIMIWNAVYIGIAFQPWIPSLEPWRVEVRPEFDPWKNKRWKMASLGHDPLSWTTRIFFNRRFESAG